MYLSVTDSAGPLHDEPLVESHGAYTMVSGTVSAAADPSNRLVEVNGPIQGYADVRIVRPDASIWRQGRAEYASIPVGPGPRKLATYSIMLEGALPRGSTVHIDQHIKSSDPGPKS